MPKANHKPTLSVKDFPEQLLRMIKMRSAEEGKLVRQVVIEIIAKSFKVPVNEL